MLKIKKNLHATPFTQGFAANTACPSPPNTSAQVSGAEADARGPDTMDGRAPPTQHSSRWPAPSGWSLPCPCVCLPNPSQAHRRGHPHGLPTSRTRARPPPPPGSERGTTCTCDDYYNHASVRRSPRHHPPAPLVLLAFPALPVPGGDRGPVIRTGHPAWPRPPSWPGVQLRFCLRSPRASHRSCRDNCFQSVERHSYKACAVPAPLGLLA